MMMAFEPSTSRSARDEAVCYIIPLISSRWKISRLGAWWLSPLPTIALYPSYDRCGLRMQKNGSLSQASADHPWSHQCIPGITSHSLACTMIDVWLRSFWSGLCPWKLSVSKSHGHSQPSRSSRPANASVCTNTCCCPHHASALPRLLRFSTGEAGWSVMGVPPISVYDFLRCLYGIENNKR